MIVRIQYDRSVYLNVQADVTFSIAPSGSFGKATLTIPRSSPGWRSDVLDERGGFLVEVTTARGTWTGVADPPRWLGGRGVQVTATHISRWLDDLRVGTGVFVGCTAGTVVRALFRQVLAARGATGMRLGFVVHAPPILRERIVFQNQRAIDVLVKLHELTGQEWLLTSSGEFHWLPHVGVYHDRAPFVDDGHVFTSIPPETALAEPNKVIEINERGIPFVTRSDNPRPLRPLTVIERL